MDILKETSENLQLYFQLGDIKSFERMNELLNKHFVEKSQFTDEINNEIESMQKENTRIDFVHIAHRIYKKGLIPKDFKSGMSRCERIINSMVEYKK